MPRRARPRLTGPLALGLAVVLGAGGLLVDAVAGPGADAAIWSGFAPAGSEPIAPGALHEWGAVGTQYGDQRVNIVTAEPYRSELSFRAAISNDRVSGLERTSLSAKRMSADGSRVVAAINADVWSSTGSILGQAPNGIHVQDGELVAGDTLARAVFGVGPDRTPRIGQIRLAMAVTTASGAVFKVRRLNQRPDGGLNLFTGRFGARLSTALSGREVVIDGFALPLRPSGAWTGTVREVRDAGGGAPIAPGTVVLVAPRSSFALYDLTPGTPVALRIDVTPGWGSVIQAVSGRGFLVRDGVATVSPRPDDGQWTHPRSALGLTWDGRVMFLTVDGRGNGSRGMNLDDLAALLVARGAAQAINLDGGSSSSLAVRRTGDVDVSIANTPPKGYEIRVTNSLQLVSNVPTGPLAIVGVTPAATTLYPGGTAQLRVTGQDWAYNGIPLASGEVAWSADPAVGTVDEAGRFVATGPGTTQVSAAVAGGATASATVEVLPDLVPPVVETPSVAPTRERAGRMVPIRVAWPQTLDGESGLAGYELERSVDAGEWTPVALDAPGSLAAVVPVARYATVAFRLRAVDRAGNAGEWRETVPLRVGVAQETSGQLVRAGTWKRVAATAYDGGKALTSRSRGARATFTFTGAGVGLIASEGPRHGQVRIAVDGEAPIVVDLRAARSVDRRIVWARSWPDVGEHTVTVTVVGTKGRARVDLDAFLVLAPAG